ncbi:hypothetical protein M0R45_017193 [Rubus argutus]|uniref:Factor of DNA methylation 1-5/IDN2 domain-containing protein n=1 Tax=Rubus argutus TaxID=59490 RepID=A0AAW1XUW4_RUBAR
MYWILPSAHLENSFLEEDKALAKFEAAWKNLGRGLVVSEAPKYDFKKELEDSEAKRKELEIEIEQHKKHLQQMNDRVTLVQRTRDELASLLAEEINQRHKEKDELHRKNLELEVKTKEILDKFNEVKDDLEDREELNKVLTVMEREHRTELQAARKELINGLQGGSTSRSPPLVGLKRVGELDEKPFRTAIKKRLGPKRERVADINEKALVLCSQWEAYLKDPSWHPFKVTIDEGKEMEVIDDDDEKLNGLKMEFGDEVFEAVKTALVELNEYNPSGRYPVQELWNFDVGRKASLAEGVSHILKPPKQKKRRTTRP